MPNHVTNVLTLHGEPEQIRAMLEAIQYDELGIGSVDFNKIIPMPESLNIEAGSQTSTGLKAYQDFIEVYTLGGTIHQDDLENIPQESENAFLRQRSDIRPEEWELGKAAWNNIRLYGVPTWYGWRNQHWGTKWNSYGYGEAKVAYQEGDTMNFLTAWSAPHPVMEKLAEMFPDVELEHEWADEDIGHNCGRYRYQNGVRIEEWFPETEREAIDLGCELMGLEPLDYGLALNAAGTSYVNLEDDEYEKIELLGKTALFSNARLTDADIPEGLYCYHLRHSDDGGKFCSIEPRGGVNHGGSVILKEPLDFGESGYIPLDEETSPNFSGERENFSEGNAAFPSRTPGCAAGRLLLCADPVQLRSRDLDLRQPAPCHVEQLSADRISGRQAAKGRHRKQGLYEAHPAV